MSKEHAYAFETGYQMGLEHGRKEHEHIELTEPFGLLTVPGVREYVCRLEPVGEGTVNVTVCAPTEPIVRCRDCKYNAKDTNGICYRFDHEHFNQLNDFCSWGKRREDA